MIRELSELGVRIEDFTFGTIETKHPFPTCIHAKLLPRPIGHLADIGIGAEFPRFLAIVRNRNTDLPATVAVEDFRMMGVAIAEFPIMGNFLIGVLGEDHQEVQFVLGFGVFVAEAGQNGSDGFVAVDGDCLGLVVTDLDMDLM